MSFAQRVGQPATALHLQVAREPALSGQQGLGLQNGQGKEEDVFLLPLATKRCGEETLVGFPIFGKRCHSGLTSMLGALQSFATDRVGSRF